MVQRLDQVFHARVCRDPALTHVFQRLLQHPLALGRQDRRRPILNLLGGHQDNPILNFDSQVVALLDVQRSPHRRGEGDLRFRFDSD
jgi:hypothetical protein